MCLSIKSTEPNGHNFADILKWIFLNEIFVVFIEISLEYFLKDILDDKSVYRRVSNIRRTWIGNEIDDHSAVVGASPVSAAPTTSSFSTEHLASIYCVKTTASRVEKHLSYGIWFPLILEILR